MTNTMKRVNELIKTLDFDGLVEALEKIDNMEIADVIIERMFEVDEEKAIKFEANY